MNVAQPIVPLKRRFRVIAGDGTAPRKCSGDPFGLGP